MTQEAKPNVAVDLRQARAHVQIKARDSRPFSHDPVPETAVERRRQTADYSKTFVVRSVSVSTDEVQVLYEHLFERVDRALFIATKAVRSQGRIVEARRAEARIEELLARHETDIEKNLAAVNAHLQSVHAGTGGYQCDHVRTYEVVVHTGFALRFLTLTLKLDELIGSFQVLEILNVFTLENSAKSIRSWLRWYRRLCREIQAVRQSVMTRPTSQEKVSVGPTDSEAVADTAAVTSKKREGDSDTPEALS